MHTSLHTLRRCATRARRLVRDARGAVAVARRGVALALRAVHKGERCNAAYAAKRAAALPPLPPHDEPCDVGHWKKWVTYWQRTLKDDLKDQRLAKVHLHAMQALLASWS